MDISVGDFATQKTRILSRPCDTCITRPHGQRITVPNHIITDLICRAVDQGDYVICHSTLPYVNPTAQPAVCRGFADTYDTRSLRLIRRLWGFLEIDPPQVPDG